MSKEAVHRVSKADGCIRREMWKEKKRKREVKKRTRMGKLEDESEHRMGV